MGGSSDNVNDCYNLSMVKKWSKPVDVLGEPCDTSSPLHQENLTKMSMDTQEEQMSEAIQMLQEENRILRQKLSALRKREIEDREEQYHFFEESVHVAVEEKNQSGDPLKEITTEGPISPIRSASQIEGQLSTENAVTTHKDLESKDEISVDVLKIVGSCTPIPSSFCMEPKGLVNGNESGISGDDEIDYSTSTGKSTSQGEVYLSDVAMEENNQGVIPPRNPALVALQQYTDTETESTTSNNLEYTYSDMSLKSEESSRPQSVRSGSSRPQSEQNGQIGSRMMEEFAAPVLVGSVDKSEPLDVDNATIDSYRYHTSDFLTPDTTKSRNQTLNLDAFRLCNMRFDREKNPQDKQDSSCTHSRHVNVSSAKYLKKDDSFSCNFRPTNSSIGRGPTNMSSQLLGADYASFDLSEIPTQGSVASFSSDAKLHSCRPRDAGRRKTPEPVFMSTPVTNNNVLLPGKSALRKKSASAKVLSKKHEKENRAPLYRDICTKEAVLHAGKDQSSFGVTPKSSIPPWQRQRILQSIEKLNASKSYSCSDLTSGGEMGMTTMFDRAERHRTLGLGNSLPLEDKEELDRLMERVMISHSSELPDCTHDSSMLKAVRNIGDAMADFVQATAEMQAGQESTRL